MKVTTEEAQPRHTMRLTVAEAGMLFPPGPVGYLHLVDGFAVAAHRKPRWLHRWAMRAMFGWKWVDAEGRKAA